MNNNHIRTLPYELGKLFQLQILGLAGNPLSKECMKLYSEANGTQKLLTYLLDSLQGKNFRTILVSKRLWFFFSVQQPPCYYMENCITGYLS